MDISINEAYGQLLDKLQGWLNATIEMLPNLLLAAVILTAFVLLGKLIRKMVDRLLHKATNNQTIIDLLETIVGVIIVGIGLFIALGILNLQGTVTSLLAGAGIIGLAIGFAFQDIAANFISGILLSIRHPFGKGDIIESNDFYGTVRKINLRNTLVKTPQGQLVYIPNKEVYENPFINYTANNERRIDLSCGVSYGDDLEKAKELAIEAVKGLDNYNSARDVEFYYDEFGGSSINFSIRFWVDFRNNPDYLSARSDAIMAITNKFDEHDIMIPFPIRTLDFGIRGGEKLNAMLENREQSTREDN
ncbi:small conductance mechanosensitive channel [Fodinibius salinus]|uniref:Small conductance mechanosensitive channel n=1 Tax=Fodinibius salinus TaxID=860790 RepID=A0A5D3YES6_9BACT|nr:mechanosensitive ion channel family protein [Fodinibius salinus]TYP91967.1 small conductance mechanosensitive channel [Fodinibius salinus]